MNTALLLVGLSHRRAPVEVRERAALTGEQAAELSRRLAGGDGEAVCLSTCNRTEIYGADPDGEAAEERALAALSELSGIPYDELGAIVYRLRDDDVPSHLYRVAAGLDSLVPGEGEILGQVRDAYERGAPGVLLDRMFRGAIHAGRKVRTETAIGEVPASVAAAAAALAEQLFGDLSTCSVMLVGAGKTGELAAGSLAAHGARIALVANRSAAKGEQVAARYGGAAVALAEVGSRLPEIDVVVSSTSARGYVLSRADVEATLRARKGRPLFLIDIAVPRDIDPAVHELSDVYVYDIDDLEAVVVESAPGREGEAARAEAIAVAEATRFAAWRASRDVAPEIALLRERAEEIRTGELDRARARLGRLTDAELRAVEAVTSRIVDKLLHVPTVRLKEAAAGADGALAASVVRDLFDLGDDAGPGRNPRQ
jgi:glutamyl-tRNA reductase